MRVIVPGHVYHCEIYDIPPQTMAPIIWIGFMRRIGPNYPGNAELGEGTSSGTNCQEVIRVLIDRCKYLEQQKPCRETRLIIRLLRSALWLFEVRAKRLKKGTLPRSLNLRHIEEIPTCSTCGHIYCKEHS